MAYRTFSNGHSCGSLPDSGPPLFRPRSRVCVSAHIPCASGFLYRIPLSRQGRNFVPLSSTLIRQGELAPPLGDRGSGSVSVARVVSGAISWVTRDALRLLARRHAQQLHPRQRARHRDVHGLHGCTAFVAVGPPGFFLRRPGYCFLCISVVVLWSVRCLCSSRCVPHLGTALSLF